MPAENLAGLLGSDRVAVDPGIRGGKTYFTVALRVLRLDFLPGRSVLLKAEWTIFAGQGRKDAATRTMSFSESLSYKRYETMLAAFSHTVGQLSREIAREIASRG